MAMVESPGASSFFRPTIANTTKAPLPAPGGMVWIPGGEFSMGASDPPDLDDVGMKATLDARPIHRVYVDGFFMDKTDVTNAQFAEFVKATGYVTIAEKRPRLEDYPDALPENLVAGSVVFSPPDHAVALDNYFQWWKYVPGANWRHALGQTATLKGRRIIQSFILLTLMLKPMRGGLANVCPRKLSGSFQLAAVSQANPLCGAILFDRMANGWPTRTRVVFL
jgi:formylglycine-generating enzyme required for sulfatase activity